jgi:hypothetical protein
MTRSTKRGSGRGSLKVTQANDFVGEVTIGMSSLHPLHDEAYTLQTAVLNCKLGVRCGLLIEFGDKHNFYFPRHFKDPCAFQDRVEAK